MPALLRARGRLARWNAGIFDLPAADLIEIDAWLDASRCITATVLMVLTVVLHQTLFPNLPVATLLGLSLLEIGLTLPYRRWLASGRWLGALIYTQFVVDIACFTLGLHVAPELPNEFHFLYLLIIVPCALFSLLCGLVMATLSTAAHLSLVPELSWSTGVVIPVVVYFLVAQQTRFYGERLVAKSQQAETGARMAEALLAVVRALATESTSGSLLQRVTELARDLTGGSWSCALVRDPATGTYRVMGLASRSGVLDEEIRSVAVRADGFDAAFATLKADACLAVRAPDESPIPAALSTRWHVGPFLAAALRRGDEALGVLLVGQDEPATAFHPTTERLLAGIAHQTVLALDNARLVDELRAASSLKSEFIGTMSHELRSPLNAIIGYTDLLRDEAAAAVAAGPEAGGAAGVDAESAVRRDASEAAAPSDPDAAARGDAGEAVALSDPDAAARLDTLDRIRFYALQLLEMIQATLDVSRLEAGRLPLHEAPVDLGALMRELRSGVPECWGKPGVALEWAVPADLPVAMLDAPKLVTVIRNLVHNALKFTERGRVVVHARLEPAHPASDTQVDDTLIVNVSDTGIGIPPEQLGTVFEMFRQVDGSDSRRHGGVGLGLYIVTRLTQALSGRVAVESTPGEGSTFTVSVPIRAAARDEPIRAAS